jgi:guanosine-3',5'-bis(diphosphate) 3'-pyrophosphohydrolase
MMRQYELVERVRAYDPEVDEDRLNRAYVFTVQMHGAQKRASGDPYFSHPVEVAGLMTDLKMDQDTIITALLHDTVEDTLTTIEDIENKFGPEVARLVDGVTKLSKIEAQTKMNGLPRISANFCWPFRTTSGSSSSSLRIVCTICARCTSSKVRKKRRRIAKETMDIYAPLAERIGMYEYMREMQLLAFQQLEPEAYETITGRLKQIREKADVEIDQINQTIAWEMEQAGLKIKISGREKHPYSIWKKMQERHVAFEQLTDINAFRVITETEEDCYRALGVLHRRWQMVPGRFKDFVSTPKRNGYKSIHTTIMLPKICGWRSRSAARKCTALPNMGSRHIGPINKPISRMDRPVGFAT